MFILYYEVHFYLLLVPRATYFSIVRRGKGSSISCNTCTMCNFAAVSMVLIKLQNALANEA